MKSEAGFHATGSSGRAESSSDDPNQCPSCASQKTQDCSRVNLMSVWNLNILGSRDSPCWKTVTPFPLAHPSHEGPPVFPLAVCQAEQELKRETVASQHFWIWLGAEPGPGSGLMIFVASVSTHRGRQATWRQSLRREKYNSVLFNNNTAFYYLLL